VVVAGVGADDGVATDTTGGNVEIVEVDVVVDVDAEVIETVVLGRVDTVDDVVDDDGVGDVVVGAGVGGVVVVGINSNDGGLVVPGVGKSVSVHSSSARRLLLHRYSVHWGVVHGHEFTVAVAVL
jgi:hypothetical protein